MQATQHATSSGTQTKGQIDTGKYIGYTLGGDKPTLYFEKGHLTQSHEEQSNIGWHPIQDPSKYGFGNIKKIAAAEFFKIAKISGTDEWTKELTEFIARFEKHDFDGGSDADALLFEYSTSVEDFWGHVSRGKLVIPGDQNFNHQYDVLYANTQMLHAVLAPNEVKK